MAPDPVANSEWGSQMGPVQDSAAQTDRDWDRVGRLVSDQFDAFARILHPLLDSYGGPATRPG